MAWKNTPECSGKNQPRFEKDPTKYFDWLEGCYTNDDAQPPEPPDDGPPPPPPCKPMRWLEPNGECWERVCTDDGPEWRRCPGKWPRLPLAPQIVAIRVTGTGSFNVLVATQQGIEEQKIGGPRGRLRGLVGAMLSESELPDLDIRKVPLEFWERHKDLTVRVQGWRARVIGPKPAATQM